MKAMVLNGVCNLRELSEPLVMTDRPIPVPGHGQILLKVLACGVCHTELDEIEGRTPPPLFPVVPGHEVVGRIEGRGEEAKRFNLGDRVGVAWIFSACGECVYCKGGEENLCPGFKATGRDVDGGYAEYMVVDEAFAYTIPEIFSNEEAAPLLCAGAVGYRSLRLAELKDGQLLGLTGFGASGHLNLIMAKSLYPHSEVFVFARSARERAFALELGAAWAGDAGQTPPSKPNAIIDTTPVWRPVLAALKNLAPGGRLVINAIRKEESDRALLAQVDYAEHLWMEKEIKSVANVTRRDVEEFLALAAKVPIRPGYQSFPLHDANRALLELKAGGIRGAKVLSVG